MLTLSVICWHVIVLFATRKCQKIQKNYENNSYWRRNPSYLNVIFRKTCLVIILKLTKRQCFTLPLQNTILENHKGGSNWAYNIQKKGEQEWVYTNDQLLALFAICTEAFYQSVLKDYTYFFYKQLVYK